MAPPALAQLTHYETLRAQAVRPNPSGSRPDHTGLEIAFVERQGLAAWLKQWHAPQPAAPAPPDQAVAEAAQATHLVGTCVRPSAWVLALVNLVLGNHKEVPYGRES